MKKKYTIWIGLPAFNEEKAIEDVLISIEKLKIKNTKTLVFNDGSTDKTVLNLKKYKKRINLKLIDNKKNQGLGIAVYSLMKVFKNNAKSNDKLVLIDCDNTHDPKQILRMIEKTKNKRNFVVIASRFQKGSVVKNVPFLRVILSYLAFIVFNTIFKTKNVRDFTCGYRMYDKDAIKNFFNIIGSKYKPTSGFEMQVEIILKLRDITTSFFEIPIYLDYKKKPSESKMKVIKAIFNYLKLIANRI